MTYWAYEGSAIAARIPTIATVIRSSNSVNPHHRRQAARPASLRELGSSGSAGRGLRLASLLRGRQAPCTHCAPCCWIEPLHIVATPRANCFGSDLETEGAGAGPVIHPTQQRKSRWQPRYP